MNVVPLLMRDVHTIRQTFNGDLFDVVRITKGKAKVIAPKNYSSILNISVEINYLKEMVKYTITQCIKHNHNVYFGTHSKFLIL